jgi:hypothetical protein
MLFLPCLYGSVCVHFCVFVLFLVLCLLRYFRSLCFFCFGVDVEGLCFLFAFFVRVSPLSELGHVESKSQASGVF